jgi:hypothetical protein
MRNLGRSLLYEIKGNEDWKCFVCAVEPLWDLQAFCANAHLYSEKIKRYSFQFLLAGPIQ